MLRQVKNIWLIVNIPHCVYHCGSRYWQEIIAAFGVKKDRIIYCEMCQDGCNFCLFTQAQTDWQLPLAEPLPITSRVTSPPNTNMAHSIVPPLTLIGSFPCKASEIQMQKELRIHPLTNFMVQINIYAIIMIHFFH